MSKLHNVRGRITYISSHAKQENLYAVYETTDCHYWTELARFNQQEFLKSGTKGECIEARELIIALPKSFPDLINLLIGDDKNKLHVRTACHRRISERMCQVGRNLRRERHSKSRNHARKDKAVSRKGRQAECQPYLPKLGERGGIIVPVTYPFHHTY